MWQISGLVANEWYNVTFVWLGNQSINTMLHLSDLVTITWNNDTLPMTVTSSTELLASTCRVKPSKCLSTLNMLNCFEDYKRYIHILRRILDLAWPKLTKLTLEQQYIFHVLCSQYHACWCTCYFGSQCISRHGTDPHSWINQSPA